jgi:diaminohydroxyphosphoribosylaminopyrimidine deaminase/5-amino-6-(5-phosphoribosylamino)uracil reductase
MNHEAYMQRCIQLAKKGLGNVSPNPLVGSVIVCDDKIIGEGYHQLYGKAHAEVNAIKYVNDKTLLTRSTLYVNLEPCAHFGKTPPCANLIIQNKIPNVVIGCIDSFAKVAGKGIEMLKNNGVKVIVGICEQESLELNKRFFTFHENKRPFIILKWAQTQDGFIAPDVHLHESKRWITNKRTQALVHLWRSEETAILVGKNTVIKDNTSLTVREVKGNNPIRVVLDKNLELYKEKESYKIFNTDSQTIIFNQVKDFEIDNLKGIKIDFNNNTEQQILTKLYKLNIQSIIIEGGAKVLKSFIGQKLFDEVRILQSKNMFGSGIKAPDFKGKLKFKIESFGDEILIF